VDPALVAALRDHAPVALMVGFGHPDQEEWIVRSLDQFPSVRLAVGVGGAVDYVSGAVPLPPLVARRYGLEWAWRLTRQPWRLRRIIRAVIEFPLLAFLHPRRYARLH
ncbi:WecB/TagA/CpsF family glycosyltransferase, partial [Candidatus Uhrbacteria bacterium]|nr:WecB/TagA/CpsF family glycosyltransferase [Candidatus Uhrbacteria bacterium]